MHERPIKDLVDALRSMGASIDYLETEGYPPLRIGQANIDSTRVVSIKANVSSQFLTALLMAAPLCAVHNDVVIQVEGELISRPYIQITLNLMARFGVQVQEGDNNRFIIPQGAAYQSPGDFHIEGDASSASYFMALGLLGGGPIHIDGVGANSIQGDMAFADVITALGGQVEQEEQSVCVSSPGVAGGWRLKAFDQDFNLLPDAAMTAAVLALFADGPCLLRNIGSWRVKETDRIAAMHTELEKLGAQVESGPDWLQVYPLSLDNWQEAQIATYDDHRMAMCFSLAAFGRAVDILDPHCVAKTFPDYFRVFQNSVYV